MTTSGPAPGGNAIHEYLATPGLDLRPVRLRANSPDYNPVEAIEAQAREEVTTTYLRATAAVQKQMRQCYARLPARVSEV